MEAFTEGSFLNTDDNLYLEFASPKQVSSSEITTITRAIDEVRSLPSAALIDGGWPTPEEEASLATAELYRGAKVETIQGQRDLQTLQFSDAPEGYDEGILGNITRRSNDGSAQKGQRVV